MFKLLARIFFWHVHRWSFSKRVLIGPVFLAEHVCSVCKKKSYIPYASDDRYFDVSLPEY